MKSRNRWLEQFAQDVHFTIRKLYKTPGFTSLATLILALGIGANAAMFAVIDSVLLRPLPFHDAHRLMAISAGTFQNGAQTMSWLNYSDLREQSGLLENISAYEEDLAVASTSQGSQQVIALKATSNLLDFLQVRPILGRSLQQADNDRGAPPVALLSAGFWRQYCGADPSIVGQQVRVGNVPHTIIGVLPDNVAFPRSDDLASGLWLPLQPSPDMLKDRGTSSLYVVGRLKPGISLEAAQGELNAIASSIRKADPKHTKDLIFSLQPYRDVITASIRPVLGALAGALLLVLVIACANVTSMQFARSLAKQPELAVRAALGANRGRLFRQALTEGAVISATGALAGLALAAILLRGVHSLPSSILPRVEEIHLRVDIFAALAVLTSLSAILSSLVPAVLAARTDPEGAMREAGRNLTSKSASQLASIMVVGEVTLSVILLVATGLIFRTLYNLEHVRLGFENTSVITFRVVPADSRGLLSFSANANTSGAADSAALRVYAPMLERIRGLPGVVDAALASSVPLDNIDLKTICLLAGRNESAQPQDMVQVRAVSSAYVRVLGMSVIQGRMITDDDIDIAPRVAIINETFARRKFAGQNPIGQRINLLGFPDLYTIVGISSDAVQHSIAQPVQPEVELSYQQVPPNSPFYSILVAAFTNYIVKTRGDVPVANAIRQEFRQSAPRYAVDNFKTLREALDHATFNQSLGLSLIGAFAGVAVLLVLTGVYGVLSQSVGQRKREIAIRMAHGATRTDVFNMVVRRGIILIAIGLAVGLPASWMAGSLLRGFLFGVKPADGLSYFAAAIAMLLVGVLASIVPASRATRIDSWSALRFE